MGLDDVRDVIIIVAGSLTILVLIAVLIFTVVIGVAARILLGTLQNLAKTEVTPLVSQMRQTAGRVQGTATFIGETAVTPIIRVYAIVVGTRRAMGVLSGVTAKRNPGRKGKKESKEGE